MTTKLSRKSKETQILVELDLAGGPSDVKTPIPFLNHMLGTLAKHGGFGLRVSAQSKDGDEHHLTEDVAIALGQAFKEAVAGGPIKRFGHEIVPMDDALIGCYLDFGGRGYYEGALPSAMYEHFLRSFAHEAGITLHVVGIRGQNEHHVLEAAFKALARSLRHAVAPTETVASTKGRVETLGG